MRRFSKFLLGFITASIFVTPSMAQTKRNALSPEEAEQLEIVLNSNPKDLVARARLLEYYFAARIEPSVAIPARRRHILWAIENAPDQNLAYGPAMTIDQTGHTLADPKGFQAASDAWRAQIAKPNATAGTLANAAYFFKAYDKSYTIDLLKRALKLDQNSKEISARLGDEYALAILGITAVNRSGYPVRNDPALGESLLAKKCREELAQSQNPYVVAKAGYQLLWQGNILYYSGRLTFDPNSLSKNALDRAVSLAPGDQDVAALRSEYDKYQLGKQPAARRSEMATVRSNVSNESRVGGAREITATDLKKVSQGMTREQVLALGTPSSRITMDEDGELLEIYHYSTNGSILGTVRLKSGVVASVQTQ